MNDTTGKSGPIHFYPTEQRPERIPNIVEYCVQLGDRQPLLGSQAVWLVSSGQVLVDGKVVDDCATKLPQGTWQVTIRGRNHQVVVYPAFWE